jgi:hypothetical protein
MKEGFESMHGLSGVFFGFILSHNNIDTYKFERFD